jgi:NADPH-dependent curcumin reductase CurA
MAIAWRLKSRPSGQASLDDFELHSLPLPPLGPEMVQVRNRWLSVDPYMRGKMSNLDSYTPPYNLGEALTGGAVGEVVASTTEALRPGDWVRHSFGWRDEAVGPADAFVKLPDDGLPRQDYLGHLGVPGASAYFGLLDVAAAKPGDTVFVSAASGAVGSAVVQIAKLKGMIVIGSAGGPEKCALVRSLGADAAIDYKSPTPVGLALAAAAPAGIDVYFDNVGGEHLDAALSAARRDARFCICGMISNYDKPQAVQSTSLSGLMNIIGSRITIRGFLVSDFNSRAPAFQKDMRAWLKAGVVKRLETIRDGLDAAPAALLDLFQGGNRGKMLIRLP